MTNENKKRYISIAYVSCLLLFFSNIPFTLFIKDSIVLFILNLLFELIALVVFFVMIKKEELKHNFYSKIKKKYLYFLPFILICFTNFIIVFINKDIINHSYNELDLIFDIILCIPNVLVEEFIFRYLILYELNHNVSEFRAILFSALIFGGIHIFNITSLSVIPIVLLQVLYTFGIGLILGLVYTKSKCNIIYPIILHLVFNVFNDILVTNLFILSWNLNFFLVNIIVTIIIGLYSVFIYKIIDCEVCYNVS